MIFCLFLSVSVIVSGIIIHFKSTVQESKLAGTGVIYLGVILLLSEIFFLALKKESTLLFIIFIIIFLISIIGKAYFQLKLK